MNEALVSRAMMVAEREHRGQVRKYTLVSWAKQYLKLPVMVWRDKQWTS